MDLGTILITAKITFIFLKDLEQNKHFWPAIGQIDYQLPEKIKHLLQASFLCAGAEKLFMNNHLKSERLEVYFRR